MYSLIIHGRRSIIELQKKCGCSVKLLHNVTSFANSFTSASDVSLQDGRKGQDFAASYLVDSLGLSSKLAESISRKVSFEEKGNPDSVLSLLRSHGFTDSQISTIITGYPLLLIADAEKSLGPKLKFLQSRGALTSELTEIISTVPKILGKDVSISKYYDFVKEIIEADKSSKFEKLCHHSLPQGSRQENKMRNILVLRELGMPQQLLFPLLISRSAGIGGKEKFEESLKKVIEMGFDPTSSRFVQALSVVYKCKNETIEEKVNVYKRLGFVEGDVWAMFKKWPAFLAHSGKKITQQFEALKKCGLLEDEVLSVFKKYPRCISVSEQNIENSTETFLGLGFSRDEFAMIVKCFPQCLNSSAETIKTKTEFLVKKMNWPLKAVTLFPQYLGYSMKKRIVPRCNVIKALLSKRLLGGDGGSEVPSVASVCACTDEAFVNRYVRKHDDDKELVAELMVIFTGREEQNR